MRHAVRFVRDYLDPNRALKVLDVGSQNVCGCVRPLFDSSMKKIAFDGKTPIMFDIEVGKDWFYVGMDQEAGKNVDVVVGGGRFPFGDNAFDVSVSTSCFEHDVAFWVTFGEMARVTKEGGLIYLLVPSTGPYHAHPIDCWRFQRDSMQALAQWIPGVELAEAYLDQSSEWGDVIGIFEKRRQGSMEALA